MWSSLDWIWSKSDPIPSSSFIWLNLTWDCVPWHQQCWNSCCMFAGLCKHSNAWSSKYIKHLAPFMFCHTSFVFWRGCKVCLLLLTIVTWQAPMSDTQSVWPKIKRVWRPSAEPWTVHSLRDGPKTRLNIINYKCSWNNTIVISLMAAGWLTV